MNENDVYKKIADEIFLGLLLFKKDSGDSIFANKMAREILGLTAPQLNVKDLFPNRLRQEQRGFSEELFSEEGLHHDITVKRLSGESFIANVGIKILDDSLLVTFEDITYQKKLQREVITKQREIVRVVDELKEQNKQLRELDKAKDRFFALTSHELRTPLSSIIATAQFMDEGYCTDPAEVTSNIHVIFEEGKHLLDIINDILDFSKIQASKLEIFVEEKDPVALLQSRVSNMGKYAEGKKIQVNSKSLSGNSPAYFDEMRLTQVIDNVLNNAVKYNCAEGRVDVSWSKEIKKGSITLVVKDTGPGISPENASKVFNEFETIENIRNHQQGTGLGMPICKKLMELMGGRIYFESVVGQGSTFFIEIPTERILDQTVYRRRGDLLGQKAS